MVRPADISANVDAVIDMIQEASGKRAGVLLFPELCVSGYTSADLFFQDVVIKETQKGILEIADATQGCAPLVVIGAALSRESRIYNCAVVIQNGKILGAVPKTFLPENREYYEKRWFASGKDTTGTIRIGAKEVPFGTDLLFEDEKDPEIRLGVEVCEDLWAPDPPSVEMSKAGALLILNPSASNETIGKAEYREDLILMQSARLNCAYLYTSCGYGESSTDLVFSGDALIAQLGKMLARSERFSMLGQIIYAQADPDLMMHDRRMQSSYKDDTPVKTFRTVPVNLPLSSRIDFEVDPYPFVPSDLTQRDKRSEEISNIQAMGLARRIDQLGGADMVVGVSGGLDSTLALLVAARAADMLGLSREKVHGITMPGFGTTDRTYQNAVDLIHKLGMSFHEIPISRAAAMHLEDIGHDGKKHDATYENAQARERTQVLMDFANQTGGIVVGTGDLSELALGWATYNGDHMSMYGVNAGVPKTLVRYLVDWYARGADEELGALLKDILDTPVSPELLPPVEGEIAQKTEDLVGPYALHDFFLFHFLRNGFPPEKIYQMAVKAFDGEFSEKEIAKWLNTFFRRFFTQQFKRSTLPDGPKVGSVTLSPRGDWRMPSDASARDFLKRTQAICEEVGACI